MAYEAFLRVNFGGKIAVGSDPSDIWSCTVSALPAVGDVEAFNCDNYLAAIFADMSAWFQAGTSFNTTDATLEYIKCNAIGPDGKYIDDTATHVVDYDPVVNGGNSNEGVSIISVAVSWTTAKKRGPGANGRIYLPNNTFSPPANMVLAPSDQTELVTAGKALLTVLASSGATAVHPVVASKVNASNTPITGVRVGSVKDVQRRRKDALIETYVGSAWP